MTSYRTTSRAMRLVLLLALVLAPAAWAQTAEDVLTFTRRAPGVGARLTGLGGASFAGIGDYAALYSNPAGLGLMQSSQFTGSLSALSTGTEARFVLPGAGTSLEDRALRDTRLGNLAYVYKAPTTRGSLVVAAAYSQVASFDRNSLFGATHNTSSITQTLLPFDDEFRVVTDGGRLVPEFTGGRRGSLPELAYFSGAVEFYPSLYERGDYPFEPAVWYETTVEQAGEIIEDGHMSELNFGGAFEASKGVLVGVSANLLFGRYSFRYLLDEYDVNGENDDYSVEDGDYLGFSSFHYTDAFESDLTGFNLRGGFSAEVAPGVRLGASVETPTFFSITDEYERVFETVFDQGGALLEDEDGTFEYQLRTPWKLGAGVGYEAGALTLLGDVEYVDWSQARFEAKSASLSGPNDDIRASFEPVVNARVGAEYRLGDLALRGGFAMQPDPRNYEIDQAKGGQTDRSRTFFSAGIGYRFAPQFSVDLGWMQERFDDQFRPYDDPDIATPVVDESVVRNRFVVGVRVAF